MMEVKEWWNKVYRSDCFSGAIVDLEWDDLWDSAKLSILELFLASQVPQPIVIHCEHCTHKITSYEPLPDSMPCPNCDRRIDLK
jgi:hypothetical protein